MTNQNPLERLKQLAAEMENKLEKIAKRLSQLPKTPQAGDIFRFDNPETVGLQWVLLFSHSEDKHLWLTVPADDNPMTGSTDIAISKKALCGPLTLRCGQSVWKRETDLDIRLRVGVLENWHRYRATDKVKQVFEGQIQSTAWQRETEADPEYEEWMEQVSHDRGTLKQVAQLTDFELIETSEEDVLMPSFTLAWRLDKQRTVRLELSWEDGSAQLVQTDEGEHALLDDTLQSLLFYEHRFEFEEDEEEWYCELLPDRVSKIAKAFNLAQPYQDWESTIAIIQALQERTRKSLLEKTGIYLTATQRKIIEFLSQATNKAETELLTVLEELFQSVLMEPLTLSRGGTQTKLDFLNPLVIHTEKVEENKLRLTLIWTSHPEIPPKVIIEIDGESQPDVQYTWETEVFSCLHISHLSITEETEVGGLWNKETGELHLSFRK